MTAIGVTSDGTADELPENWCEFDAWLDGYITHHESYLDGEDNQRADIALPHFGAVAALEAVRQRIAHLVAAERAEKATVAHEESIEQQYRDQYGDEPLAPYQAEGR